MPQFLKTILYIILFLVCLSAVVCIHEAGHLAVAKLCKVYCFEYSIGFGPAIFKHKFKHKVKKDGKPVFDADGKPRYKEGETQFALRCLPFGGYVSRAGEDREGTEDGVRIPENRTLTGTNHAKQIAIRLAGIARNFLLAIFLFFVSYITPHQVNNYETNKVTVVENYEASKAGLKSGDQIYYLYQTYHVHKQNGDDVDIEFPKAENRQKLTSYLQFKDGKDTGSYDDVLFNSISYASLNVYSTSANKQFTLPKEFEGTELTKNSYRRFHIQYLEEGETDETKRKTIDIKAGVTENIKDGSFSLDILGISNWRDTMRYSFSQAFVGANQTFGQRFVGVYSALGSLFTPNGWKNVGGIVSVYRLTTSGVESGSLAQVRFLWGYISLNLGCFNLLPLPGLDGWQTRIALGESVTRKKAPSKFKAIANGIGLAVRRLLAVLLIVKDIIIR